MAADPSNGTPFMFTGAANLVAVDALPVKAAVIEFAVNLPFSLKSPSWFNINCGLSVPSVSIINGEVAVVVPSVTFQFAPSAFMRFIAGFCEDDSSTNSFSCVDVTEIGESNAIKLTGSILFTIDTVDKLFIILVLETKSIAVNTPVKVAFPIVVSPTGDAVNTSEFISSTSSLVLFNQT